MLARLLVHLLLLALVGGTAHALTTAPCAPGDTASACRYSKGLLWKVERPGQKPSYLFGTIHLSDPRVMRLPPPVKQHFDAATSFTLETVLDDSAVTELANAMLFKDEHTLAGVLGPARYSAVQRALERHGAPPVSETSKLKPWVIATLLAVPPQQQHVLDLALHARASRQNKPVHGLESSREQIGVFDSLALTDQIELLDEALAQHPQLMERVDDMVRAYVARDLHRMEVLVESQRLSDAGLQQRVMDRLLFARNRRMFERMQPRLIEGNAFIAVGALHLPGDRGLLALLERAGWHVTPVY